MEMDKIKEIFDLLYNLNKELDEFNNYTLLRDAMALFMKGDYLNCLFNLYKILGYCYSQDNFDNISGYIIDIKYIIYEECKTEDKEHLIFKNL